MLLTATERLTMNTRPKNPANARNLNFCGIGSSGSGKTRFWLTPQLLQAHSSYVVVDPKGGVLGQVGSFLQKRGYKIKVFNSIDFSKSMHYNPLAYIKTEADILKFVNALISNTKGEGKEGDPFWTTAETLLYCALLGSIIFEGAEEDRNMNTLVDMISGMEVKEDDEDFLNAVDYKYGMYGVLIYTASGDSEGSLGGLVRQGAKDHIEDTIRDAVRNAAWCSSDPVCIQSYGQGPESCNLAACHNCALLPETCCECGNRLLDRGTVVGTLDNKSIGFFAELLEQ